MSTTTEQPTKIKPVMPVLITVGLLPILWLVFFESNNVTFSNAIPWSIIAWVALCILWLLVTECKFTMAQVLFALGLTSLELLLITHYYPWYYEDVRLLLGCAPLLSFVGLFVGARMAGNPADHSRSVFWFRFLLGLLLPLLLALLTIPILLYLWFHSR